VSRRGPGQFLLLMMKPLYTNCHKIEDTQQSFCRSFTTVFRKVGRCASEEVIVELLKTKSLPSLLYGTEACPVNKSVLGSLEFVINNIYLFIVR